MSTPPPHPAAAAAAAYPAPPWHLARSLQSLLDAVNAHWPARDKRSDGGIGNAAHAAEGNASDHNPWLSSSLGPAVRAYDFTTSQGGVAGVDGAWLAECLRLAGASGDDRLAGKSGDVNDNGYVIHAGHITSPDFARWVPYTGTDPHITHVHVSVTRDPGGFEDARPWTFLSVAPVHPPVQTASVHPAPDGQQVPVVGPHPGNTAHDAPAPVGDFDGPETVAGYNPPGEDAAGTGATFRAQHGNTGPRVKELQRQLNGDYPAYSGILEDGIYGDETAGVVQDFARRVSSDARCPEEHRAHLAAAHGDNIGPALAAVFPIYGIHV